MLLESKVAVIYGDGGSIGGAVANYAAFVASDRASAMTGAIANLTCGSLVD